MGRQAAVLVLERVCALNVVWLNVVCRWGQM